MTKNLKIPREDEKKREEEWADAVDGSL